jgi:hypothetical protein
MSVRAALILAALRPVTALARMVVDDDEGFAALDQFVADDLPTRP